MANTHGWLSPDRLLRFYLARRGISWRQLDLGSCTLSYYARLVSGRPTVVLLHGISASAGHWAWMLPALTKAGYGVVAPELPAHGFSGEHREPLTSDRLFEAFVSCIDELVPGAFHLIGNSLGGAIALRYALEHEDRLLSVVALSPAGGFASEQEWERFKAGIRMTNRAEARAFLNRIYARPPLYLPLVYQFAIQNMQRKGIQELLDSSGYEVYARAERLSEIAVPMLFVWGKCEKLFAPQQLEWFKRHLPKTALIEEPEQVGHCPQLDSHHWLANRLLEFYASNTRRN